MPSRDGPTPGGGSRSTLTELADGTIETVERDDAGRELVRTYAERGPGDGPGALMVSDQDWLKTTWDLWTVDDGGIYAPLTTLAELAELHDWPVDERARALALAGFLELPVWDVAPAALREEAYAYLREHLQRVAVDDVGTKTLRDAAHALVTGWEAQLAGALEAFYAAREAEVLAGLGAEVKATKKALVDPAGWSAQVATPAGEVLTRVYGSALDVPSVREAMVARVRRIMAVTEERAAEVVAALLGGGDLDAVIARVKGTFEQRQVWAAETARTEVTGAVNEASLATAARHGLAYKRWLSSRDDRVRPTHQVADGQQVALVAPFTVGGFPLRWPGDPLGPPQEVINCLPDGTLVEADYVELAFRRTYLGRLVRLSTCGGHELAGTPNHPVLTPRGWVALIELQPGDHLVRGRLGEHMRATDPHVQRRPTAIEQVVDTARHGGVIERRAGCRVDFHGDGIDAEVEVVATDSLLWHAGNVALQQPGTQQELARADLGQGAFSRESLVREFGFAGNRAAARGVGGERIGTTLLDRPRGGEQAVGLAAAAWLDAGGEQSAAERWTSDSELARELVHAGAVDVALDEIVSIEVVAWHGMVSNLQTGGGWYIANGFITQNCRCTLLFAATPGGPARPASELDLAAVAAAPAPPLIDVGPPDPAAADPSQPRRAGEPFWSAERAARADVWREAPDPPLTLAALALAGARGDYTRRVFTDPLREVDPRSALDGDRVVIHRLRGQQLLVSGLRHYLAATRDGAPLIAWWRDLDVVP